MKKNKLIVLNVFMIFSLLFSSCSYTTSGGSSESEDEYPIGLLEPDKGLKVIENIKEFIQTDKFMKPGLLEMQVTKRKDIIDDTQMVVHSLSDEGTIVKWDNKHCKYWVSETTKIDNLNAKVNNITAYLAYFDRATDKLLEKLDVNDFMNEENNRREYSDFVYDGIENARQHIQSTDFYARSIENEYLNGALNLTETVINFIDDITGSESEKYIKETFGQSAIIDPKEYNIYSDLPGNLKVNFKTIIFKHSYNHSKIQLGDENTLYTTNVEFQAEFKNYNPIKCNFASKTTPIIKTKEETKPIEDTTKNLSYTNVINYAYKTGTPNFIAVGDLSTYYHYLTQDDLNDYLVIYLGPYQSSSDYLDLYMPDKFMYKTFTYALAEKANEPSRHKDDFMNFYFDFRDKIEMYFEASNLSKVHLCYNKFKHSIEVAIDNNIVREKEIPNIFTKEDAIKTLKESSEYPYYKHFLDTMVYNSRAYIEEVINYYNNAEISDVGYLLDKKLTILQDPSRTGVEINSKIDIIEKTNEDGFSTSYEHSKFNIVTNNYFTTYLHYEIDKMVSNEHKTQELIKTIEIYE